MKFFTGRFLPFWGAFLATALFWASLFSATHAYMKYAVFAVPAIWSALALRARREEQEESARPKGFWRRVGRRLAGEYAQYWYAWTAFWLLTVYWVSYPHPATRLGWLALSAYLGCYLPLFIGVCRAWTRWLRLPIWLAAPVSWVAIEWLRNRVFGGFSFAGLSHAIYDSPDLLQLAEPLGEYGVSAFIVLIGSLVGRAAAVQTGAAPGRKSAAVRLVSFAAIIFLAVALFGRAQIEKIESSEIAARNNGRPFLKVGLLQDCTQYRFPPPRGLNKQVSDKYRALALKGAREEEGGYDVLIWPEGTSYGYYFDSDRDYSDLIASIPSSGLEPSSATPQELRERFPNFYALAEKDRANAELDFLYLSDNMAPQRRGMARLTAKLGGAAILGTASAVFSEVGEPLTYNSAVYVPYLGDEAAVEACDEAEWTQTPTSSLIEEDSTVFRRYDKIHLVMFGEYIPFLKYLPDSWELKSVCSETILSRGRGPTAFRVSPRGTQARFILAPNVCFESLIPQFIKNQLRELRAVDADPDILVNVSHDGWFRCGVETDMHLATHVFRAIENRRSVVTATHGGFSAWIDPAGRVRSTGSRGNTEIVKAQIFSVKPARLGMIGGVDLAEAWSLACAALTYGLWLLGHAFVRAARRVRKRTPGGSANGQPLR